MLHKIGTLKELDAMTLTLPECVMTELTQDIAILDCEYGENRVWSQEGGYSAIMETTEDVTMFKNIVDYDTHPCEWATKLGRNSGWLSALYLLNDDYAVMAFMPVAIAPKAILADLEE